MLSTQLTNSCMIHIGTRKKSHKLINRITRAIYNITDVGEFVDNTTSSLITVNRVSLPLRDLDHTAAQSIDQHADQYG